MVIVPNLLCSGVCFLPSKVPREVHMRKASTTDCDSKKAICPPFSSLADPYNCACPLSNLYASLDVCPHLSFPLDVYNSFKYAEKEQKFHFLLREVCICITFLLNYVSVQIYRDMTSVHSAEHFNLTEGKCQLQTVPLTHLPLLDSLLQFQAHLW